jgi:YhcH/YjgK/YiaL family protein
MIIDTLENTGKYYNIHPSFEEVFKYLAENDLNQLADGTIDMPSSIRAFLTTGAGKTKETSLEKFECHDEYIDIQLCIKGEETFGWKPRNKCFLQKGAYNPEKDVRFFADQPDMYFQLTENQFAVFFPEDVHAPMIGNGEIKKMVVKIKI